MRLTEVLEKSLFSSILPLCDGYSNHIIRLFGKPDIDLKSLVCIQVLRAQARLTTFYGAFGLEKFRFVFFIVKI